ncbi:cation:proton antiporter [Candidatus Parvarchaeota archaeon]|nr:cation:proton antiporter [Candidatus Parvarchaeota archaeon]
MVLNIIIEILIVLSVSIIMGELFEQLKFPSVVGYLIAGLVIGPFVFNFIQNNTELQALSSLSLFFIIFLLGIEMKTESVIKYLKPSIKMSITSFILPLLLSVLLSVVLFHFGLRQDFIVSLSIAVPSISIISVLVMRYRLARDPKGITIIGSVVITDVIAFLLLGIAYKSALNAILVVIYFIIFLLIFLNVDKILNRGSEKLRMRLTKSRKILKSEHFGYAMIIIIGLLIGGISQLIGVNYIIGVFFAGLIIHEGLIGRTLFGKVRRTIKRMNDGFFIPLFFSIAGIDVASFHSLERFIPAIVAVSLAVISFSIILNYYSSGRIMKIKKKSWKVKTSAIINGRGAVGIAIATVAFEIGVITNSAYSIAILATIIISIVATSLLRNT